MKDPKFYVGIVIGLSMSLVLLSIGFFVGPAYTAPTVGTDNIVDDAIISQKIKDSEVKTQDLANGAVTKDKISPFALKLVTAERNAALDVPAHTNAGTTAKCNKGEVVTGGGYIIGEPDKPIVTYLTRVDLSSNGWFIAGRNTDDVSHTIIVSAVCVHLAPGP